MTRERAQRRDGYTLAELLVVAVIIVMLIAAALPVARKVMEDSRTREASRQLSAYCAMARTRAAESGRPWGIWIELERPLGVTDPTVGATPVPVVRQATKCYLAEVQPAYAGGTTDAKGKIADFSGSGSGPVEFQPRTLDSMGNQVPDSSELAILYSLINQGEYCVIRFDYKGEWFKCLRGSPTNSAPYTDPTKFYYYTGTPSGTAPGTASGLSNIQPPSTGGLGFPFQILRTPRRVGSPLEIATGSAIDLPYSGMGPTGTQFAYAYNRVVIMFMPSGAIDGVFLDQIPLSPQGTLHFLLGKVEKVADPQAANTNHVSGINMFEPTASNLADTNSFWLSIGRNGSVTTTENAPDSDHASHPNPWNAAGQAEYLLESREYATNREQMGGK